MELNHTLVLVQLSLLNSQVGILSRNVSVGLVSQYREHFTEILG